MLFCKLIGRAAAVILWLASSLAGSAVPVVVDLYTTAHPSDPTLVRVWRGQYSAAGAHPSTLARAFVGKSGINSNDDYNSYFVFDLGALAGQQIVSASLRLQVKGLWDDPNFEEDASETFSVHDVSVSAQTVQQTTGNATLGKQIFVDLGTSVGGVAYGTGTVLAADAGGIINVPLSARAVNDLMNATGLFAFGLTLDSFSGQARQEGILFAAGNERIDSPFVNSRMTHQLVLEVVPVPEAGASVLLLSVGIAGLALTRARFWRR